MTKRRLFILLTAALAALCLCACGDTVEDSSAPEGLQTFGVEVDPSAQPSTAAVASPAVSVSTAPGAGASGTVLEGDVSTSSQPSEPSAAASTPTVRPSTSRAPTSPAVTATPSPEISPPAPASTANQSQAEDYVGRSLSDLIADLGYPSSSDYEYIDEEDPDQGEIGTLVFDGFTVTTRRDGSGETITSVNAD